MVAEVQFSILQIIYVVSAAITLGLAAYGIQQLRKESWDDTTAAFVGIVLGTGIWSVARFFELLFVSEFATRAAIAFLYIGYGPAGISILLFALAFTGRKRFLQRRWLVAIFALPALVVLVAATNTVHELMWAGEFAEQSDWWGTLVVYDRDFKPLFLVYMIYVVGLAVYGVYLLLRSAVESPDVYQRQTIAFTVGAIAGLGFGVMFGLEMQPIVPDFIDLSPVGFAIMGLCFGYAIFRHQMLDIVPVARDTVIESMRDGYIVLDTDGRIVDLNNAAMEVLDTTDQVIGDHINRRLPDVQSLIEDHEHGERVEGEITLEIQGEQRFLVANVSSLHDDDHLIGRLLLLRDVTDRRAVQKRYQALIENSSDLILVIDRNGIITYASPSIRNITGVEPETVTGQPTTEFLNDEDTKRFENTFEELLENPGKKIRTEYQTFNADGEWIDLEASMWNLMDNPFVEGIVLNAREITERKKREREITEKNEQLTRANEQLEQFASVISHDLRNPINVAKGHLELAEETGREESFEKVDESLERMEAIIDDVLTLARQGQYIGETTAVSLEERATTAWEHVATDDAELDIKSEASFQADPDRLLQLFENLFRNAHEHVGEDVTVRVGLENGALFVEDDGPGIPEDERENVLESGHTTNEDGTGLGLSIVAQIANAHGWDVHVTDGESGGARFEFTGIDTGSA